MRRVVWLLAVAAVGAVAGCGEAKSNPGSRSGTGAGAGAGGEITTAEIVRAMAALAGELPARDEVASWARKLDAGEVTLDAYIDALLGGERFARDVMPSLLFGSYVNIRNYYALPSAFLLRTPDGGGPLYLRAPCDASAAVEVHPWWDLTATVAVCPDAYRPEKWAMAPGEHSYKADVDVSCDSQIASPEIAGEPRCGCGPNLIRCLRNEDEYDAFNASLMDEVKRTTAYVVAHDLPMATLFTGNATFRDRNVELYYRRQQIGALRPDHPERVLAGVDAWPAGGKWAPRDEARPGQHAGVLTTPQILHWSPDRRQRQRLYYEVLWCNLRNTFGATTHKVLELNAAGNNFFNHASWARLAHTELCTTCHARLDYGFQYFMGYQDSRASTHYDPRLQLAGDGPLYGRDIDDPRGEAPLTPQGFAKLATAQPEFASCMANHFVTYVLGDRATADDVAAIEGAVATSGRFRPVMKVALQRFARRWREHATVAAASPPARPRPGAHGGIVVSPPLREALDRWCVDCHDEGAYSDAPDADLRPFDFRGAEQPRALLVSMADKAAFGTMPKHGRLDDATRDHLVGLLLDELWPDPAARREAERYYLGRGRGLPAHQIDNALFTIDRIAHGRPRIGWGALERGIWSDQSTVTPGFVALTSLEALRACASSGSARLEACLHDALSLRTLTRSPTPTPAPAGAPAPSKP